MLMNHKKTKTKLRNLRYRMKKAGYIIDKRQHIVIMPEEENRSTLMEQHIKQLGYNVQYQLFNN
jgi:hypothetical protein